VAPVSALSVIVLIGFMGGADTTEVEGFCLLFEIRFILCLLPILAVLSRFQEELLLCALQRSLLPPIINFGEDFVTDFHNFIPNGGGGGGVGCSSGCIHW